MLHSNRSRRYLDVHFASMLFHGRLVAPKARSAPGLTWTAVPTSNTQTWNRIVLRESGVVLFQYRAAGLGPRWQRWRRLGPSSAAP
eukprot:975358-Rhodomonas_salina.3